MKKKKKKSHCLTASRPRTNATFKDREKGGDRVRERGALVTLSTTQDGEYRGQGEGRALWGGGMPGMGKGREESVGIRRRLAEESNGEEL